MGGDGERLVQLADVFVKLQGQLPQAVKMTVVVKFTVVGQGVFDDKVVGQGAVGQQLAVLGGKSGVVFAGASVFVAFAVVDGDIAEDDAQIAAVFRSGDNLVAVGGAVFYEGCLFPQVA